MYVCVTVGMGIVTSRRLELTAALEPRRGPLLGASCWARILDCARCVVARL